MTGLVVAGVDGSRGSLMAVDVAAIEAELRGWTLRLVYADAVPPADPDGIVGVFDEVVPRHRDEAERALSEAANRVRRRRPAVAVTTHVVRGAPAPVLIREAAHAGLVVIGNRGYGGFTGLLAGSVSVQVAMHAPSPVVVVRIPARPVGPEWPTPPVVIGIDGSPASEVALSFAATEARMRGAALVALHGRHDKSPVAWTGIVNSDALLRGVLARHPAELAGLTVHERSVPEDAREGLINASGFASLVVVGSRGRGGFAGLVLGSTSQALLHHAHCPVAIAR